MIYVLENTEKVKELFEGWEETLVYSCLQKVMGKVFVTDLECPKSAMAFVGCFAFYAGEPDKELVATKPEGFIIMTPQNEAWAALIEECFPDSKRITRYAIKKDTQFDIRYLLDQRTRFSKEFGIFGYEMKTIDGDMYDLCMQDPVTKDFVSSFESKEQYLEWGRARHEFSAPGREAGL